MREAVQDVQRTLRPALERPRAGLGEMANSPGQRCKPDHRSRRQGEPGDTRGGQRDRASQVIGNDITVSFVVEAGEGSSSTPSSRSYIAQQLFRSVTRPAQGCLNAGGARVRGITANREGSAHVSVERSIGIGDGASPYIGVTRTLPLSRTGRRTYVGATGGRCSWRGPAPKETRRDSSGPKSDVAAATFSGPRRCGARAEAVGIDRHRRGSPVT